MKVTENKTGIGRLLLAGIIFVVLSAGYCMAGPNDLICATTGCTVGFAHSVDSDAYYNTASGSDALISNTPGLNPQGYANTAFGYQALDKNTIGYSNIGIGLTTLWKNDDGYENIGIGTEALYMNISGFRNTAVGTSALLNTTGSGNTAIGYDAGISASSGTNNIYVGSGVEGTHDDSGVIRIGNVQTQTFLAGIWGTTVSGGSAVYVNSSGQLGTVTSSRRFKDDIADMGEASGGIMKLRPVTFHYKKEVNSGERALQYGLVAEEVAKVYPELVVYGTDGKPLSVQYHLLSSMLLNEMQKQQKRIEAQDKEISELKGKLKDISDLKLTINTKDREIQALKKTVAEIVNRLAALGSPMKVAALRRAE